MYEISNRISYDEIMKQQTLPPKENKVASFISGRSQWINVTGTEVGNGDHYVAEQGDIICKMVNAAFKKASELSGNEIDAKPELYIITPFTSVVRGLRKSIESYANRNKKTALGVSKSLGEWLYDNIGTVHKFQGKEANEVIFALGCDEKVEDGYAVKGFVNSKMLLPPEQSIDSISSEI
jgi:superfamily I DNA and/or RNA helicase